MTYHSKRKRFCVPDNTQYHYGDGRTVDFSPGYHPHFATRFRNWGDTASGLMAARELPELYHDRSECCGCTACKFVCPKNAISMEPDEEGFLYPVIDAAKCIRCSKCEKACVFKIALGDRWEEKDLTTE